MANITHIHTEGGVQMQSTGRGAFEPPTRGPLNWGRGISSTRRSHCMAASAVECQHESHHKYKQRTSRRFKYHTWPNLLESRAATSNAQGKWHVGHRAP
eukprot:CAMPEP_0174355204 /NCGR_PEP_ID=MMETSP0811_2-20130205/23207_1 /TAXON_ID=73025 ORGANISM="Eutreptiella gymnastica-like, Strain CCMP1594" /NCGR_SAMPLE_ID=MMETSP0811_2 /ASSEMBLY_ACC=CAM_ASM_000667 /LENGTH=98 /DNA_ID=CAMNT_0015486429 /DNA_START=255 /DNA_END=551 /DNA_ORIENTATION=+